MAVYLLHTMAGDVFRKTRAIQWIKENQQMSCGQVFVFFRLDWLIVIRIRMWMWPAWKSVAPFVCFVSFLSLELREANFFLMAWHDQKMCWELCFARGLLHKLALGTKLDILMVNLWVFLCWHGCKNEDNYCFMKVLTAFGQFAHNVKVHLFLLSRLPPWIAVLKSYLQVFTDFSDNFRKPSFTLRSHDFLAKATPCLT